MKIKSKLSNLFLSLVLVSQSVAPTLIVSAEEEHEESPMFSINSDWRGTAYGDVGGNDKITSENFEIKENEDNSVLMRVSNNRGKIAGSADGISYYYKDIADDVDFDFSVDAEVIHFDANNQVGFGISLRNEVFENINGSAYGVGDYISVGAVDQTIKAFTRKDGLLSKDFSLNTSNPGPSAGQIYNIQARKIGNNVVVSVGEEQHVFEDIDMAINYVGLFVARNAEILYHNPSLTVHEEDPSRQLTDLVVDSEQMKTDYLVNESLNIEGLQVEARYSDGSAETLDSDDFLITGFDSSQPGINTVTVSYRQHTETFNLSIVELDLTEMKLVYLPAKLNYYLYDSFNPEGMIIEAEYNNGETIRLSPDLYSVDAPEVFEEVGTQSIKVSSTENPDVSISLSIEVLDAELESVSISQHPQKTVYFLEDALDLTGLVVYANYADGTKVRLLSNDYKVSDLDTSTTGTKAVTITHKGIDTSFDVVVKAKEVVALTLTGYPKTTYTLGEVFDPSAMQVAIKYDNGDLDQLSEEEYTLEVPDFDETGQKMLIISHVSSDLAPFNLPISIVETPQLEWKELIFGQSISSSRNSITQREDGVIEVNALEGGGKVTGDHDGISFYYTELNAIEDNFELHATINVLDYAKNPHDGQESFGIMARDAVNTHLDSSVFASNIAAIGGYSGGTSNPNGIQLFTRSGIISPDGEGSQGITSIMIDEHRPLGTYDLMLKKTNSGFVGSLNNGEEHIIYQPSILESMNDTVYVGFYAARLAHIEVSNINMTVTKTATDAPRINPPTQPIEPSFNFDSLNRTSTDEYALLINPNVNGTVTIRQGNTVIARDIEIDGNQVNQFETTLADRFTPFSVTFYPNDTQYLTSYQPIVRNFSVELRTYEGDIHVAPEGRVDGDGSQENPLDVDTAIDFVQPGQKIILLDGVYNRSRPLEIKKYNDGKEGERKYLVAAEGTNPVFDFNELSEGGILSGNYWHIKGVDFRRSAGNRKGFTVGGSHNIIEMAQFYENGDTGLQISRTDNANSIDDWPSYNLMLNVTSFDNRDPSGNNADGFAAKLTSGVGNIFRGAIAYNNIDDGWDLYTKSGSGKIGAVLIEDSITYNNGFVSYDPDGLKGDGNGFKLGGEGIHVEHVIKNSLAFGNLTYGFTSNSNPGVIAKDNVGFNNGIANISFTTYNHIETDFTIDGFASYHKLEDLDAQGPNDSYPSQNAAPNNFFYNGGVSMNSLGVELTDDNFESLEFSGTFERDENGDIIWGPFLNFISPKEEENDSGSDNQAPGKNKDEDHPSNIKPGKNKDESHPSNNAPGQNKEENHPSNQAPGRKGNSN